VAVGLTWLASVHAAKMQKKSSRPVTKQEVEQFVAEQDKPTLIQWILDRAKIDDEWWQQLLLKVAAQRSNDPDTILLGSARESGEMQVTKPSLVKK
jgi:hypothetical protein